MKKLVPIFILLLTACHNPKPTLVHKPKKDLSALMQQARTKYHLTVASFDSECIDGKGDLTDLLTKTLRDLLPSEKFTITETVSADGKKYVAVVHHQKDSITLYADTHDDYLPEGFSDLFENIPVKIGSDKRFYMINPKLLGQDVLYFCGTEAALKAAQKDGLPLIKTGDNFLDIDVSDFE